MIEQATDTTRTTRSGATSEANMTKTIQAIPCGHQGCNNTFVPRRPWQKFCSPECKDAFWAELRKAVAAEITKRRKVSR